MEQTKKQKKITFFEDEFLRLLLSSSGARLLAGVPACAHSIRTVLQRLGVLLSFSSFARNSYIQTHSRRTETTRGRKLEGNKQGRGFGLVYSSS